MERGQVSNLDADHLVRHINLKLDGELAAALQQFMDAHGYTLSEAVRIALRFGLGVVDNGVAAGLREGALAARREVLNVVTLALREAFPSACALDPNYPRY